MNKNQHPTDDLGLGTLNRVIERATAHPVTAFIFLLTTLILVIYAS
jgi:hypothetical protein